MAEYQPIYPSNHPVHSSVKQFISRFFATSDTPGLTDQWVGFFRDDATLVMGHDTATGKQEIRKLRITMWKHVSARKHTLAKVFPASFEGIVEMNAAEFMLFGSVTYRPRAAAGPDSEKEADEGAGAAGQDETVVDWAAHGKLKRDSFNAPWGFAYYRVYLQR